MALVHIKKSATILHVARDLIVQSGQGDYFPDRPPGIHIPIQASIHDRCHSFIICVWVLLTSAIIWPRAAPVTLLAAESHALIQGFFISVSLHSLLCRLTPETDVGSPSAEN